MSTIWLEPPAEGRSLTAPCPPPTLAIGSRLRFAGRPVEVVDVADLTATHRQLVLRWLDRPTAPLLSVEAAAMGAAALRAPS